MESLIQNGSFPHPPTTAPGGGPSLVNRCSLPPWALASADFQREPWPLEIVGVEANESRLFRQLETLADPAARGDCFHQYLVERFQLRDWLEHHPGASSASRHNYLRFLRDWGFDSNGKAGAVLKSWVESRFGLRPTFHAGRLELDAAARDRYATDRMKGEAETVAVVQQLDLLYTFCQKELARRHPGQKHLVLYRGTHDPEEYAVEGEPGRVRLNNLSSFTADREIAWEFGSLVWEVQVPLAKIVFFSGLLPRHLLEGEKEYLVLGGEYRVKELRW